MPFIEKAQRYLLHVSGDELVHDTASDGDTWQNRGQGEGQAPGLDVGEDETSNEGGEEVNDKSDLLRNALLDKI